MDKNLFLLWKEYLLVIVSYMFSKIWFQFQKPVENLKNNKSGHQVRSTDLELPRFFRRIMLLRSSNFWIWRDWTTSIKTIKTSDKTFTLVLIGSHDRTEAPVRSCAYLVLVREFWGIFFKSLLYVDLLRLKNINLYGSVIIVDLI